MSANLTGFRLSPLAKQDLEEIWQYTFQQWSPVQADNYAGDLLSACEGLVKGEKIGLNADEIRTGYRKYFCGLHTLYYKISGEYVDVIRILHQSRDVDTLL
jgi:toxin ParE1/3/4